MKNKRKVKNKNEKVGRPPGEISYIGDSSYEGFNLVQRRYDPERFTEDTLGESEQLQPGEGYKVNWIEFSGFKNIKKIKELAEYFNIHPMLLEDVVNTYHLPKYEEGDDYIAVILKSYVSGSNDKLSDSNSICIILKAGTVIDLHESPHSLLDPKIERIKQAKGKARVKDADYLFYVLLDAYIDTYYLMFDDIQNRILDLEDELLAGVYTNRIEDIHNIQNELTGFRKFLLPLKEAISILIKEESDLIHEENLVYFNDLKDHLNQLVEYYFSYTDMIKSLIDLNNSNINNNINQVMKVLTIIATIFIPLTFIAGIYGMNFENMPELKYEYGYPLIMAVMVVLGVSMFIYMKIKKWF